MVICLTPMWILGSIRQHTHTWKNSVSGLKMSMVFLAQRCHALSLTALSWFESHSSILVWGLQLCPGLSLKLYHGLSLNLYHGLSYSSVMIWVLQLFHGLSLTALSLFESYSSVLVCLTALSWFASYIFGRACSIHQQQPCPGFSWRHASNAVKTEG